MAVVIIITTPFPTRLFINKSHVFERPQNRFIFIVNIRNGAEVMATIFFFIAYVEDRLKIVL